MSLNSAVRAAFRRLPASMRGTVTLTAPDGRTTTALTVGVPTPGDRFKSGQTTGDASETFSLLPDGLSFTPAPGMTLTRGAQVWSVVGVHTLDPSGTSPALYRVEVTR